MAMATEGPSVTDLRSMPARWLAAAALIAAPFATRDTIASVARVERPSLAERLRPWDPVALAVRTDRQLVRARSAGQASLPALSRIRQATDADPLHPEMLRLAGLVAAEHGDDATARARMQVAERLSRRDIATELWLAEDSARRGDSAGAIARYDAILSVHPGTRTQFFPVLTAALAYPQVRKAVMPYVRRDASWALPLLAHATTQEEMPAPRHIALLIEEGDLLRGNLSRQTDQFAAALLRRLLREGEYRHAFALAGRRAGPAKHQLGALTLTPESTAPELAPFTWQLARGAGVMAVLDEQNRVQVRVARDRKAVVLSRVLALAPGVYELGATTGVPAENPVLSAGWSWYCLSGGREAAIGTAALPSERGDATSVFPIEVPPGCEAVRIELTVEADDRLPSAGLSIEAVALRRLGDARAAPSAGDARR